MDKLLTVIAPPTDALDTGLLAAMRAALTDLGADTLSPVWLAPGHVAEIPFTGLAPCQADAAARRLIGDAAIDVAAQEVQTRRKKALVADMDSTMVIGETLDELADFAGLKERIAAITARAMNGELDFKAALRERVGLLRGLPADSLQRTFARLAYMPGAEALVATMRANGALAVLVSGGFRFFTSRVRAHLGFDRDLANEMEIVDDMLTGRVIEPILDRETKLKTLLSVAGELQVPLEQTLAVGDGANDLDMIKAAGLGVAYHAKPVVAAEARVRIQHNDLTALLYLQGYHHDEIIRPAG